MYYLWKLWIMQHFHKKVRHYETISFINNKYTFADFIKHIQQAHTVPGIQF